MRILRRPSLFAVSALTLVTTTAVFAQSATGGFHITFDDGLKKNFEFNARENPDGTGSGQMTFTGAAFLPGTDGDTNDGAATTIGIFLKVDFDCVQIRDNRAAMSGLVRQGNPDNLVGRRVLLAVEDGGEGNDATDRFTWGMYSLNPITWFPADADLDSDSGWKLTWVATDSERKDDVGVQVTRRTDVDCHSFPLSEYPFIDLPKGSGNIQVHP